eukprot:scaffold663058_cov62-Prasinocladus_malaysianus.AAC.1
MYVLNLYIIKKTVTISRAVPDAVIYSDIHQYRKRNPEADDEEVLSHVARYKVPGSVPGSNQWFKRHLDELFEATARFGLPHFFVTLTEDEVSSTRWKCFDNIEDVLHMFSQTMDWRDAPAEATR